jgi:predicted ATP-dependent serine protease
MAKAAHSFKNPNDYNEINKFLSGIDPEGDLLSGFDKTDIRGWYGTGNYMMNAHYSGSILKGAPLGRALVIAGDPKTGKSYFALEMAEELQKLGYFIQMYETEASPDTDRFIAQKINPNMFRKTPVKHIEKVIHWVAATNNQLLQIKKSGGTVPKIAYIIDSWNGLITEKDEQDALD